MTQGAGRTKRLQASCRSTLYAYEENDSLSESVAFIASENSEGIMTELQTFEKGLEHWLNCPIKVWLDSLLISRKNKLTESLVFKTTYTLLELLMAIHETCSCETEYVINDVVNHRK